MGEPALSTLDASTQGSSGDVGTLIGLLVQAAGLFGGQVVLGSNGLALPCRRPALRSIAWLERPSRRLDGGWGREAGCGVGGLHGLRGLA